jgi:hypothetical protein
LLRELPVDVVLDLSANDHHAGSSLVEMVLKRATVSECEDVRAWNTTYPDPE